MRSTVRMLLAACLVVAVASAASAADPRWQVTVGFGGLAKDQAWTPVFVDITNEGDAQTGRIVVPLVVPGAGSRELRYVTDVDLPRNAKKRYTVYVPSPDLDRVRVDLSGYRKERFVTRLNTVGPGDLVVCVIGGDGGFLSFLNGTGGLGVTLGYTDPSQGWNPGGQAGRRPRATETIEAAVGRLDWAQLPDAWLGWDGADVVALADASFSGASSAALTALRTWVECGGTLVVPGGAFSPALASGPFASLLPGKVAGTTTLPDLSALGAWVGHPLEARPVLAAQFAVSLEAEVLCGTRERPLIVSRRVGSGRIVMATFDYTSVPVKYWDAQGAFWTKLLRYRATKPEWARRAEANSGFGGTGSSMGLGQAVATMPQAQLPSVWLIVGFLIAYIVVLVPVNYSVLNRLDRRELAWVTTPGIVLLFTFGAYGMGYGMRGGAIIVNRIAVVETSSGARAARGAGYLGIFSPARTGYQVPIAAPTAGSRDLSFGETHVRPGTYIYTSPQPMIADVNMNMWTTRAFAIDYPVDLGNGISGYIEYDGAGLRARVRNDTGQTLRDCRIVRTRSQGRGKTVRPGETVDLEFLPSRASAIPSFQAGQYAPKTKLSSLALSAVFLSPSYVPQEPATLPVVVASLDQGLPAELAGEHPQLKDANLIIVHLPLRLTPGREIRLPEWMVSSRFVGYSGNVSGADPYSNTPEVLQLDRGSVTVEYALPVSGTATRVKRLELAFAGGAPLADVFAYDYTRRAWHLLWTNAGSASGSGGASPAGGRMRMRGAPGGGSAGGGVPARTLALPRPQRFLGPEGAVQVKLSVPSGTASVGPAVLRATVETR